MNIQPCFPASAFNQSENRELKPGDFPVEPPNLPPGCTFYDGKTLGQINFFARSNFLLDFSFRNRQHRLSQQKFCWTTNKNNTKQPKKQ